MLRGKRGTTELTIRRQGEFKLEVSGSSHCGTQSPLGVRYVFICSCDDKSLDARGFLFDQVHVEEYFQWVLPKKTTLSCERICVNAARDLFKMILKENPKANITKMSLEFSPAPYAASITLNWNGREK